MKTALVCGAGGFIGGHLVKRLKRDGFWVRGTDLKFHEYAETEADDFAVGDLRDQLFVRSVVDRRFDEVYQLAADMGGAGYIFTGEHDADVMHNSATINLNVLEACHKRTIQKVFYSSSACMYPAYNQEDPSNPKCSEDSAYPAAPDSEYGWEKLFSERLYLAYRRNYGIQTHVARYHNIFGPQGTWTGGGRRHPLRFAARLPWHPVVRKSKFGAMASKHVLSFLLMSASREQFGCCALISRARLILVPKKWSPSINWST